MGKLELVQLFSSKVAWSNSDVHDGWLYEGDDFEEVLYSEYWSFVLFIILFSWLIDWFVILSGKRRGGGGGGEKAERGRWGEEGGMSW